MVEESDEQRDRDSSGSGGGVAAMAALHQCELIQNMIDISISSLQGLRTKCAASNDLTQQEIRTLEVITTRGAEVQRHERADPLSRALYPFLPIFALQLFIVVHYRGAQDWDWTPLIAIYQWSITMLAQGTVVILGIWTVLWCCIFRNAQWCDRTSLTKIYHGITRVSWRILSRVLH